MTLKSAAFAPDNVAELSVNEAVPRFWMVKVRVTVRRGKIGARKVGLVRAARARIAVTDRRPIAQDIDLRPAAHSRSLQGEVVGILVCVVVADAQGRAPRAHCTRIEANLEAGSPARRHCTRRLRDDAEVGGIRSRQRRPN